MFDIPVLVLVPIADGLDWGGLGLGTLNPVWLYESLSVSDSNDQLVIGNDDSGSKEYTGEVKYLYSPSPLTCGDSNHEAHESHSVDSIVVAEASKAKSCSAGSEPGALVSADCSLQSAIIPVSLSSDSAGQVGDISPNNATHDEENCTVNGEADAVSQGRDKKASGVSTSSWVSDLSESELSRKSASVGSTSSYISLLSETNMRRKSQPNNLPSYLQTPFNLCYNPVNLQGVENLEDAVKMLKQIAYQMDNQEQNRTSTVATDQGYGDLHCDHHAKRRSKTRNSGSVVATRRKSRCDLMGVPLEPINIDVDVVKRPAMTRERRRSLQGTLTGAAISLTTPDSLSKRGWTSTIEENVKPFSPTIFRRVLGGEDDVLSDPGVQPFETPAKNKGRVSFIDISANDIECLSSLANADRNLLEKLKYVTSLNLSQNKLSEIPVSLREWLEGLTCLKLQNNNFTRLPGLLLVFPRLQVLEASHNKV